MPSWVTSLMLAEKWHVPPWEIHKARGSVLWASRQAALDAARKKSSDLDKKD